MSSRDHVFASFLEAEHAQVMRLADASDILDLTPLDPQHYLARFHCATFVIDEGSNPVKRTMTTTVGIFVPSNYLLEAPNSGTVLTCLEPHNHWHPNIHAPLICIGAIEKGERLTDIIYRTYEVISYQNYATIEWDCLRPEVCSWARRHAELFPADPRPLKRRPVDLQVVPVDNGENPS